MRIFTFFVFTAILTTSCQKESGTFTNPENTIQVSFGMTASHHPCFQVFHQDILVLDTSILGIIRDDADFYSDMKVSSISSAKSVEDSYTMYQGKERNIDYKANEYNIHLENPEGKKMDIIFRLSNDGVAFRYYFPETSESQYKILEEKSTYRFNNEAKAWMQPMSKAKSGWKEVNPSYEENYAMDVPVNTPSEIGEGWVYPALFKTGDHWVLISETDLHENYCGSHLKYDETTEAMKVTYPQKEEVFPGGGLLPESRGPLYTPWRILAIGSLETITESTLGTDLAAPSVKVDTFMLKGGFASWSWVLLKDEFTNYETSRKFIDYAAMMNWPYCLIDADWDQRIGEPIIRVLAAYAKTKKVKLLLWYNSSGSWNSTVYTPKDKLLTAEDRAKEFAKLQDMGIAGVKIDFFGGDGQSMIAYYHDILKDAIKYRLLVNFHGATLPRGWQRTYLNLMTMEAVKGEEFITFEQANADLAPSHCAMLPFTRNVFDPMDFTPMVLDSVPNIKRRTTPAFELALPVLFLSGIQHIAEIPEGLDKMPTFVIDYLDDIPVNWDESRFVDGFPGKDVIMARKKGATWYIIGINGENAPKSFEMDLSFLGESDGIIINDSAEEILSMEDLSIHPGEKVSVDMKPYGGFVIKIN